MDEFFNAGEDEEAKETEQQRIMRQAKEREERIEFWVLNNPSDVKRMVKEFRKSSDESELNSQFLRMIEKIVEKKKINK